MNDSNDKENAEASGVASSDWFAIELQLAVESFKGLNEAMQRGTTTSMAARLFDIGMRHLKKCQEASDQRAKLESKYFELLYAVEDKVPGESRHESALRCIRKYQEAQRPFFANTKD